MEATRASEIQRLMVDLDSPSASVRWRALGALEKMRDATSVPGLLKAMRDPVNRLNRRAAEALESLAESVEREAAPGVVEALCSPSTVQALIEALGEPSGRASVVLALRYIGNPTAVPALVKALDDENSAVRMRTALALWQFGAVREAIPVLIEFLGDSAFYDRMQALNALVTIGPAAERALLRALSNGRVLARASAAEALGRLRCVEAIPMLVRSLDNDRWLVRELAAEAIGRIGSIEALPALIGALDDNVASVRKAAAKAMALLPLGASSVPAVIWTLGVDHTNVYENAVAALHRIGRAIPVEALIPALRDEEGHFRISVASVLWEIAPCPRVASLLIWGLTECLAEDYAWDRGESVEFLFNIGTKETEGALVRALRHRSERVRKRAAEVLGSLGFVSAVPALTSRLDDEESSVRKAVVQAIWDIGKEAIALPALAKAIKDSDLDVRALAIDVLGKAGLAGAPILAMAINGENNTDLRRLAVECLGRTGTAQAVPALCAALKDPEESVRITATRSLGSMGGAANDAASALAERLVADGSLAVRNEAKTALVAVVPEHAGAFGEERGTVQRNGLGRMSPELTFSLLPSLWLLSCIDEVFTKKGPQSTRALQAFFRNKKKVNEVFGGRHYLVQQLPTSDKTIRDCYRDLEKYFTDYFRDFEKILSPRTKVVFFQGGAPGRKGHLTEWWDRAVSVTREYLRTALPGLWSSAGPGEASR